jgi:hypothetical protein
VPDWKNVGKKAGKAYLTGGLSLAAEGRKKQKAAPPGSRHRQVDQAELAPRGAEDAAEPTTKDENQAAGQDFVAEIPPEETGDDEQAALRPDVEAAKARMRTRFGSRRELKKLDEYLWHDETVSRLAAGNLNGSLGLLVFTDRRLLFLFHGLIKQQHEDFPLDLISSVSMKSGLASATITVYAGGAKHEISSVYKDDARAITDEIRNRVATRGASAASLATPPSPVTPPEPRPDVLQQLKQLGELRDAGVITDQEFEEKKSELLKRL